ncbi:preprotein translocase subunit SecE [Zhenpiania hominis]|uniref:Protein translocase subunit SecE n=1 Tax=Zhenpiania hominis TaxID=2763644 RepID=A0A923NLH2_9FIRM|nr:preprotein translocase subunit SecE [Zhenpiania hominis]MBC6678785.1 preprotein translocase subunit SecE [Zhenpiania hominis]
MAKEKKDKKEVANKRRTPAVPPKKKRGSLKDYFKGVKVEMKKVVWPTRKELGSYTVVVLVTCAVFALAFWGIDSGFLAILRGLLGITM